MLEIILALVQSPLFYVLVPLMVAWGVCYKIGERRAR